MKKIPICVIILLFISIGFLSGCLEDVRGESGATGFEMIVFLLIIGAVLFVLLMVGLARAGTKKEIVIHSPQSKEESKSDRRCPECGRIISDEADTCIYCGKRFGQFSNLPGAKIFDEVKDFKEGKIEKQESTHESPEIMYKKAHDAHYKDEDIETANNIYNQIINRYPNSDEADYSKQQLENIEKKKSKQESDKGKPNENKKSSFCFKCGKKVEGKSKFCPYCGTKQEESE
jgi:RNA polymerase subunit RPABC4/transcription elongation factor Spt4